MNTTAKIYTIFLPCYSPERDELLGKLQSRLDDVEFMGLDELSGIMSTEGRDEAYRSIREVKDEIDGILVFGGYLDRELTSFGLPVVMVRSLLGLGDWEKGLLSFYKGEKLVTACLSDFDVSPRASTSRFDDLLGKIKLISALKRVKDSRLLVVQEPEILGNYDILGMDFHSPLPEDYNEVYSENLKEMGLEVTHAGFIELNEEIGGVGESEAEGIADMWINEAKRIRETDREEVLKAAKLYLGMEKLMKKHGADGIAIRSLVPWVRGVINVTPCLANTELNKQLRVGVCEGLVNSAITEMFGIYTTGNPSFIGDVIGIDRVNDTVTFAHCQCPINPRGNDRVPYVIRSHALQKENEMVPDDYPEAGSTLGAAVQVELPTDETVTALKFSLYDRKIAVSTGVSVSGEEYYRGFEDILCRTKLVMKTNSEAFERDYDTTTFGVHRNIIYGDHTQAVNDLAKLMGFEVVEEM
ncbi:MAG: hypothetical protein U9Q78_04805 [Chloroflexota bacterium]|nr:hypothetical protein [Chloroflexota bacterium]